MEIKELKGVIASLVLRTGVKAKCFADVYVNHSEATGSNSYNSFIYFIYSILSVFGFKQINCKAKATATTILNIAKPVPKLPPSVHLPST